MNLLGCESPPSAAEIGFSFFQLFLTALSRTASSAWIILMSAGLSTFVTLLGAMISTRGTLCTRMALMADISASTDLVSRRRNIVFIQVYSTSDLESLTALWTLFRRGVGMPEFEVSMTFVAGLASHPGCNLHLGISHFQDRESIPFICNRYWVVPSRPKKYLFFTRVWEI